MPLFDLHNDFIVCAPRRRGGVRLGLKNGFLERVIGAVWTTRLSAGADGVAALIEKTARAFSGYGDKLLFAIEDAGFLDEKDFARFFRLPIAYVSPTWNGDNRYAGGALGRGTLTAAGGRLLSAMAAAGARLDTAHLNVRSFYGAADYWEERAGGGALLCSHTACLGVRAHPRNLSDAQIRRIVSGGGLVGLCLVGAFLTDGGATAEDYFRHIDYFASRFGIKNLAVGTDFNGTDDLPKGLKTYRSFDALRERISRAGYSYSDADAVFRANARRFFSSAKTYRFAG